MDGKAEKTITLAGIFKLSQAFLGEKTGASSVIKKHMYDTLRANFIDTVYPAQKLGKELDTGSYVINPVLCS